MFGVFRISYLQHIHVGLDIAELSSRYFWPKSDSEIGLERLTSALNFQPCNLLCIGRKQTFKLCCVTALNSKALLCSPFTRSDFPWCLSSGPSSRKWSGHVTVLATPAVMSFPLGNGWVTAATRLSGHQSMTYPTLQLECEEGPQAEHEGITLIDVCENIFKPNSGDKQDRSTLPNEGIKKNLQSRCKFKRLYDRIHVSRGDRSPRIPQLPFTVRLLRTQDEELQPELHSGRSGRRPSFVHAKLQTGINCSVSIWKILWEDILPPLYVPNLYHIGVFVATQKN